MNLPGSLAPLRTAQSGEVTGPVTSATTDGYDLYILYAAKKKNSKEKEEVIIDNAKQISIGWRGNSIYTPEFGMQPVIKIGYRLYSYLIAANKEGRFTYNKILTE